MSADPLRVLIVGLNYAPEPSGSAPYTAGLAAELAARGHDVKVVTTHPHYPQWRVEHDGPRDLTEQLDGVTVRRLGTYVPAEPRAPHRFAYELLFGARAALSRLPEADVIVFASPALFTTALAMARLRRRRAGRVVWVQDLYGKGVSETDITNKGFAPFVARVEAAVLRQADRVVTIHPNMQRAIVEDLGIAEDRTAVVRNWTHLEPRETPDRAAVRDRLGWPQDKVVALHSGNMGYKQGLEVLVDAAKIIDEQGLPVEIVLMGDGNQRRTLEDRAKGVASVRFVDPLPGDEYQDAMAAADVLLLVDRPGVGSMAVPSKLTSYFTTGNPVLGSTDPEGNAGVEIRDSGGGRVCPPGDAQAIVDEIMWLDRHPGEAAQMGQAGRDFMARVLSKSTAVDAIETLLRGVATTALRTGRGKRAKNT